MTDSQFETLRQKLRAMRGDFDQRFGAVTKQFQGITQRFDAVETWLTKLEVHLDTKPDKAFVFQTLFTINTSFIVVIGLAFLVFRSFLIPV
jgi:hypothetical protein